MSWSWDHTTSSSRVKARLQPSRRLETNLTRKVPDGNGTAPTADTGRGESTVRRNELSRGRTCWKNSWCPVALSSAITSGDYRRIVSRMMHRKTLRGGMQRYSMWKALSAVILRDTIFPRRLDPVSIPTHERTRFLPPFLSRFVRVTLHTSQHILLAIPEQRLQLPSGLTLIHDETNALVFEGRRMSRNFILTTSLE